MSGADGLAEFLAARYAEAEASARDLLQAAQGVIAELEDVSLLGRRIPGWFYWPKVEAMCTARLADIEIKRAILSMYVDTATVIERTASKQGESAAHDYLDATRELCALEPAVRQFGTEFTDHPNYKEAWKP